MELPDNVREAVEKIKAWASTGAPTTPTEDSDPDWWSGERPDELKTAVAVREICVELLEASKSHGKHCRLCNQ
jgi:hypothetical protein